MSRNLSDACWSSDDSSFGWVDMEDKESVGAKKANNVQHSLSDSEDGSSDDSDTTQFDPDSNKKPVPNAEPKQKRLIRNDPVSADKSRGQVENDASEDSDSTQFDAESDNGPVADIIKSKGNNPMTVKGDHLKAPRTKTARNHETSKDSASGESSSESSDDSYKKDLKPFTKRLLVKKERHSHVLSGDSDVDSPPLKPRSSVKSEPGTPQKKTKEDLHAPLIDGVLLDTAQPLPFDIDANEDVWIVQCPNEVSESTLKGKTLNFNGVSSAEKFEGRVLLTANPKPVTLLLGKNPLTLRSLTPTGHIIFKEKEVTPHIHRPVCIEDNITSLPVGLKARHPLFGADLSLVERLSSQVQKRKKKMKKKKKKLDISDIEPTIYEDENEVTKPIISAKLSNDLDTSPMPKKKKKKKIKHLEEQVEACSKDSDIKNDNLQLLFNSGSSSKVTSERDINGFVTGCIESERQQKKQKKVKHERGEALSPETTNAHPELSYVTPSKKRKHKHLENSFEGDRQVAGGTFEESENIPSQKKKKRKYENESSVSNDVYSTNERNVLPSESFAESLYNIPPKKKKHHKYETDFQIKNVETMNNRLEELAVCSQDMTLDSVTDELLHTTKKKKKKIKEEDTEFIVSPDIGTNSDVNHTSAKKKKKLKMENSDEHLGQSSFDARDKKDSICDVTGADLDYFEVKRKKRKEEKRKLEGTFEFSEENSPHSKLKHSFNNSLLKQESSYDDHSLIMDVLHKKKKKRKSE